MYFRCGAFCMLVVGYTSLSSLPLLCGAPSTCVAPGVTTVTTCRHLLSPGKGFMFVFLPAPRGPGGGCSCPSLPRLLRPGQRTKRRKQGLRSRCWAVGEAGPCGKGGVRVVAAARGHGL